METKNVINLIEEINLRVRLNEAFDELLQNTPRARADVAFSAPLAKLLLETIELRKHFEREEKALKEMLLKSLPEGKRSLDFPEVFIEVEERTRADLAREALFAHLGEETYNSFLVRKTFDVIQVRRKA